MLYLFTIGVPAQYREDNMERNHETWPLVSVYHYKNEINPTPTYQRYAVWDRDQQQLLMDSIYRGLDIPKLYLRAVKSGSGSPFKYEAIDGQQRLRAVWEFFDNKYALSEKYAPQVAGKKYGELEVDDRRRFELYQFSIVIVKESSDDEVREMFCRLQNGKPLNSAEKRNAMVSGMRDFCSLLAEHELFKSVRFSNQRMQYQQVAAQTVVLELEGGAADTRNTALQKLYTDQRDFSATSESGKRIRRIYDYLSKCFFERTPELKQGYVVSFYLLVSTLLRDYSLAARETTIRDFLIDFDGRRRKEEDNVDMIRFTEKISHASDSEDSIGFRHKILLREFHRFCPDLIPIDSKRAFDEHQRLAIYRRDGGKCKLCGTDVPWDDLNADHIVPHVAGGPTTVANGWLTCSSCNKKKGAKPLSNE
ncbi:MAG TPA: DUF262 domain-containing protein [Tepidisphaeraceae bacterium]|nr:DUF262 domain-containing protein [Tepidisphaeraceae bacterium]